MRKKMTLLLCIGLIMIIAMAGCSSTAKKPTTPVKKPAQIQKKPAVDMSASERRVMANRLSRVAESVPGVQKATVVVMDIKMTGNTNNTTTGTTGNTTGSTIGTTTKGTMNKSMMGSKSGTVVMVGITLNNSTAGSAARAATTKNLVAKRIKASDKRISQVLVTTDPGMIKRLNDVASGIIEGKPIQSFQKDIRDINNKLKQQKAVY